MGIGHRGLSLCLSRRAFAPPGSRLSGVQALVTRGTRAALAQAIDVPPSVVPLPMLDLERFAPPPKPDPPLG